MNRNDIGLTLLAVASTVAVFIPTVIQSVGWTVFALVYFSVAPGHALLSALFPTSLPSSRPTPSPLSPSLDTLGKWTALSIGVSIVVVPLVGLALVNTPAGLRAEYIVFVLNSIVVLFTLVSAIRRSTGSGSRLLASNHTRLSDYLGTLGKEALSGPRIDVFLNVSLVLCVLLFVGSFAYAATKPPQEPEHTQFFLPGQSEMGVASGNARYPSEVKYDEPNSVSVAVTNREGRSMNYSVVVEIQRTEEANGSFEVISSREVKRARLSVDDDETVSRDMELVLGETGENLRLVFLLYRGEAPSTANVDTAYKEVHLWVNSSR